MKWRTVLVAWAIALLALALWAVLELGDWQGGNQPALIIPHPPTADEVDRIEINRGRGGPVVLERSGLTWRQTSPIEVQLDPLAVRQLIDGAFGLMAEDVAAINPGTEQPHDLGLADGGPQVMFATALLKYRFRLGNRASAGRAWIQLDDFPVAYRTPATLHDLALSADERQWRRTALFERADVDADRVSVEALDARSDKRINMEVVRDGSQWRMEKPVRTRADQEGVLRLLEALSRAQATGFVVDAPESLAAFGLDNPVAVVEIGSTQRTVKDGAVLAERRTEAVSVGTQVLTGSPDRFGMIRGVNSVVELDGPTIASLLPDLSQLIDARASGAAVADVSGLRLERPDGSTLNLRRSNGGWVVEAASGAEPSPLNGELSKQLLERLCTAKADGFELGQAPAQLKVATVTLLGLDSNPAATLSISHEAGPAGKWAVDAGDGLLRIFDPAWGEPLENLLNN